MSEGRSVKNYGKKKLDSKKKDTKKKRHSRKYIVHRRKRNLIIAGMLIVAIILACLISFISLYTYVAIKNDDTIAEGIFVADQDIGGLTIEEATAKVDAMMVKYGEAAVIINVEGAESEIPTTTLSNIGFDMINEEKVIQEAYDYGKVEGVWANFQKIRELKEVPVTYYPDYTVNSELVQTYLNENYAFAEVKPINATISIENGTVIHHEGEDGIALDVDSTVKEVETVLNNQWTGADMAFDLPLTAREPEIQVSDIEGIQSVIGSYKTSLDTTGNRYANVGRAASLLNGIIMMPGKEISVAAVTGPYTEDNGYANAPSYANGEVVDSIGGGICQVSTTVYNAVLEAELEVTQRQAHSMTVSYVSPGLDAAIAGDYKDLKFVNNSEYPVYLTTYLNGGTLGIVIYGNETRPENRTLKFESVTVASEDMGTTYTTDSSKGIGSVRTISSGKKKIAAELWKIIFIDGVESERVKVNTSYYNGTNSKVAVGISSSDSEASKIVENAVASQNIDTINSAITKAKALIAQKAAAQQEQEDSKEDEGAEE